MGRFNLEPSAEKTWNYSDPKSDVYAPEITGTVVELHERQSRNMGTKQPEWWDNKDGTRAPKTQFVMVIYRDDEKGNGTESWWYFKRKDVAGLAIKAVCPDPEQLIGKRVRIATSGVAYIPPSDGRNGYNARQWEFEVLGDGNKDAVHNPAVIDGVIMAHSTEPEAPYQTPPSGYAEIEEEKLPF